MNECECLAGCPFFNDKMENMPSMAAMYKARYCKGDSGLCARHQIFERFGSAAVPKDLYPNDAEGAAVALRALGA